MRTTSSSPKTINIVKAISILTVIILIALMTMYYFQTKTYITAKGEITNLSRSISYGFGNDSKSELIKTIKIKYSIDGKSYTSEYRTFSFMGKKVGHTVTVHCNPDNPQLIRNPFLFESAVIGLFFFLFIFVGMFFIKKLKI